MIVNNLKGTYDLAITISYNIKMKNQLRFRQVHLDFHTSELIEQIGSEFSEDQFGEALRVGNVDSITIFSKCHHGYSYHPTSVGAMHPHLDFDLLKTQLSVCKKMNVAAPVYLSAGFDEMQARKHPEWLVRKKDESLTWNPNFTDTAGFHLLCYNTPYLDYLLAQVEEVMQTFAPEAIFLDISFIHPCYCSCCRAELRNNGQTIGDNMAVIKLAEKVYKNYTQKVRKVIEKYDPDCRIFHNGGHIAKGRRDLAKMNTHLELESLPTGGWGYDHFPLSASYVRTLGMEFLGMTGKFHTSWGEFGGYKHPNALRYETALSIALGGKCSIGDQLHPSGKMDMTTYELIGKAYSEVLANEKWCDRAISVADIGVLSCEACSKVASIASEVSNLPDVGINRILFEGKYLYDFIDLEEDFKKYKILILPDQIRINEELEQKLVEYKNNGGKILASGLSLLKESEDVFSLNLPLKFLGKNKYMPSYMSPSIHLKTNNSNAFVMYSQGYIIENNGFEVAGQIKNPYFNREVESFCSHQHTPNTNKEFSPGILYNNDIAYIAYDIFTEYAQMGSLHLKEITVSLIDMLLADKKSLTTNMPDRAVISLMNQKQENRHIVHMLFAHTTIRGKNIEVIEDIVPLYDISVKIKLPTKPRRAVLQPQNIEIPLFFNADDSVTFVVDKVDCHQMVVLEGASS